MTNRDAFKKKLPAYMKRAHMNQRELSKAVGVSESTVHCWVNGKSFPRIDVIQKIADVLGCSTDDLLQVSQLRLPELSKPIRGDALDIFADRIQKHDSQKRLFAVDAMPKRISGIDYGVQQEEVTEVTIDKDLESILNVWKVSTPKTRKKIVNVIKEMVKD